ncbi:MAG: hypothetical protein PF508_20480 [Spirochaeta sp.]|jgi:hypothetical protein|nr:hypothetical protein [Spirochaeta sp.]
MTGGLPEAVAAWCSTRDTPVDGAAQVERTLNDLVLGYERDFAKYSGRQNADSIRRIFQEAPPPIAHAVNTCYNHRKTSGD